MEMGMDDAVSKPETYGLPVNWSAGMMGMMTVIRVMPDQQYGEIMERNVVCAHPNRSVEECMAIMSTKRVRQLPVIADGELQGIVSIGDLVDSIISDREFVIEQLEHYIHA